MPSDAVPRRTDTPACVVEPGAMAGDADDPRTELHDLASALLAHAQWLAATGAPGLDRATAELARARGGDLAADPAAGSRPREDAGPARNHSVAAHEPSLPVRGAQAEPPRAAGDRGAVTAEPSLPTSRRAEAEPRSVPSGDRAAASAAVAAPVAASVVATGGLDPVERHRRLVTLAQEVAGCTACALHQTRTQTVFARGNGAAGLCFIGEGPGADEDEQGFPFVGKAGQLLDRMITAMGLERDAVYVCNIVKCRPPDNRKPQPDEVAACRSFLEQQLELLEPSVIVALGATAVQGLLGTTEGITRLRGKWKLYKGRIAVMPTFHPAYLLRTPSAKRAVWEDLQTVMRQLGRPIPDRK